MNQSDPTLDETPLGEMTNDAGETLTITAPKLNKSALEALGVDLARKFTIYEADRRMAELKWVKNARQRLGLYDPNIEQAIGDRRSKAYPKMTRVKCVSMLSRLMNLLFQASEKNWTIAPSPVPNLHQDDLQQVLTTLEKVHAEDSGGQPAPLTDREIEEAILIFARMRARNLEREIEDQLTELGGSRMLNYVALCRKVLESGINYGMGILAGPFTEELQTRTWRRDTNGRLYSVQVMRMRPRFDFVPIWDYYPDMSAKYLHQMEGQFQRIVMTRHELAALKKSSLYEADMIDNALKLLPEGNFQRKTFEQELLTLGTQVNVSEHKRGKFEVLMWNGFYSGNQIAELGLEVPQERLTQDVRVQIWLVDRYVIRAQIDPWEMVNDGITVPMFHHFVFEEDETNLTGEGLPNIMRDSQLGLCASVRMMLDNASVMRNFEVNTDLLRSDQDMTNITSDKVWFREDGPATAHLQAVRVLEIPTKIDELNALANLFRDFADQETFVSTVTGADSQKGPSEPFRSAAGASMLRGDAALPFKDVVRSFDKFTESVIGSIITFNKIFNSDNVSIRGDFQPVARGATSLIAKEVLGIQLDNFAVTLTDEEKRYVNHRELALARARVRDLDVEHIVVSEEEARRIDARIAEQESQAMMQQNEMLRAELRKVLADAFKSVSLANKNLAAAEAQTANMVLEAMESGLNLKDMGDINGRQTQTGAGVGDGVAGSDAVIPGQPGEQGVNGAAGVPAV